MLDESVNAASVRAVEAPTEASIELCGGAGSQSGASVWSTVHEYEAGVPARPQRSAGVTTSVWAPKASASHAGAALQLDAAPPSSAHVNADCGSEPVRNHAAPKRSARGTCTAEKGGRDAASNAEAERSARRPVPDGAGDPRPG